MDFQTSEECNITLRNKNMWSSYINSEIKELTRLGKDKRQFEFVHMLGKKLIIYNYIFNYVIRDFSKITYLEKKMT